MHPKVVENILRIGEERGIQMSDMCAAAGTSYEAFRLVKKGGDIKLSTLDRYAAALGVSTSTLLRGRS